MIPARKSLGQHFLPRPQCDRIVAAAGITAADQVLEIGPGPGNLTRALLATGARVYAVELDERFSPPETSPLLTWVRADFLQFDLATLGDGAWKVVANIPYYITSPILERLLESRRFTDLYILMQSEVADRLAAEGQRESGSLTLFVAWYAVVERLLTLRGRVFMPPAQVDSTLVHFRIRSEPPFDADAKILFRLVHTAFEHRRKMLRASLRGMCDAAAIEAAGLPPTARPEQLRLADFARLADVVARLSRAASGQN